PQVNRQRSASRKSWLFSSAGTIARTKSARFSWRTIRANCQCGELCAGSERSIAVKKTYSFPSLAENPPLILDYMNWDNRENRMANQPDVCCAAASEIVSGPYLSVR